MENHTFNESRKRFEPKNTKCTFCKTGSNNSKMEDNCFYSIYNVQDRTNLVVFRNVKFNEVKIGIPRCEGCKKAHSVAKTSGCLSTIVGVPLVFIIPIYCSVAFDLGTVGLIVMLVLTFGLVCLAVIGLEKLIFKTYDIKSEKEGALTDTLVQSFLVSGWSIDRPRA